jgi:hypothetical protein
MAKETGPAPRPRVVIEAGANRSASRPAVLKWRACTGEDTYDDPPNHRESVMVARHRPAYESRSPGPQYTYILRCSRARERERRVGVLASEHFFKPGSAVHKLYSGEANCKFMVVHGQEKYIL